MSQTDENKPEHPESRRRKIRSFVKREGRMSRRQTAAFETLYSKYGVEFNGQPVSLPDLFENDSTTVLEIGFGMGDSLAIMARENPEINYLGVEVHRPGVGSLLATIEENQLKNLRIINHDAVEVLEQAIPDDSLDAIQIFFPDPWPKKRHHKRRLIQSLFVELLATKLKTGGLLHIATDWENYADWITETMNSAKFFSRLPENTTHKRPLTKFEKRGIDLGHGVWDLIYSKE